MSLLPPSGQSEKVHIGMHSPFLPLFTPVPFIKGLERVRHTGPVPWSWTWTGPRTVPGLCETQLSHLKRGRNNNVLYTFVRIKRNNSCKAFNTGPDTKECPRNDNHWYLHTDLFAA